MSTDTFGFGRYGPDSEAWRINREIVALAAAGPRALLLQLAHPLIAEGVEQHSHFRDEPRVRAERTVRSYLRIVFGSEYAARTEIRRLNRLHSSINGTVLDDVARSRGLESYRARDPHLALWVHATLIDSMLVGYMNWVAPLSEDSQARFYAETRPIGLAYGIPESILPRDLDDFNRYVSEMLLPGGPISVTPTAMGLARAVLHPRLGTLLVARTDNNASVVAKAAAGAADLLPTIMYDWVLWPALKLLPDRISAEYGLSNGSCGKIVSWWLVSGYRLWRRVLPNQLTLAPQAMAAYKRAQT